MIQFVLKSLASLAAVMVIAAPGTLPAEGGEPPRLTYADVSGTEAVPPQARAAPAAPTTGRRVGGMVAASSER